MARLDDIKLLEATDLALDELLVGGAETPRLCGDRLTVSRQIAEQLGRGDLHSSQTTYFLAPVLCLLRLE